MTDMRTDDLPVPAVTAHCEVCNADYHGVASVDLIELIRSPEYEARVIRVLERDRRAWVAKHLVECSFGRSE